jgi:hypothetical protein
MMQFCMFFPVSNAFSATKHKKKNIKKVPLDVNVFDFAREGEELVNLSLTC